MRRLVVVVTALAFLTVPALSFAGQAAGSKPAPPASQAAGSKPKPVTVSGEVTAVAPDSLTVKGKTGEWTFAIDKDTTVTAKGATHKSLALKAEGKASMLTDFVKNGDSVSVTYHDMGTSKHAASIRVTQPK